MRVLGRYILLAGLAVFCLGCQAFTDYENTVYGQKAPTLRVDDVILGNKRTGLQAESPVFKPGESIFYNYHIRGFQPDNEGLAKLSYTVTMTGYSKPLERVVDARFKVNSDLTHYGPVKPAKIRLPKREIEEGYFTLELEDKVAGVKETQKFPFSIKK